MNKEKQIKELLMLFKSISAEQFEKIVTTVPDTEDKNFNNHMNLYDNNPTFRIVFNYLQRIFENEDFE